MKVKQQRHISPQAKAALMRALPTANFTWDDVENIIRGNDPDAKCGTIWNVGNLCWVFTAINWADEIEVLLAGGEKARECIDYWLQAMLQEPAHRAKTIRIEGRKGWSRLLPQFERRDGVLYMKVPDGQAQD
jgi:hypothetical protein